MTTSEPRRQTLYLDQKDLIGFARTGLGKADHRIDPDIATALEQTVASGHVAVPLSEAHVVETARVSDPARRLAIARVIASLTQRHAIAPMSVLWRDEFLMFIRSTFGASTAARPQPFGRGLPFALGLDSVAVESWMDGLSHADIVMTEMFAIAEPGRSSPSTFEVERTERRGQWRAQMEAASRQLVGDRRRYDERERLAAATFAMLDNEPLHVAIEFDVVDDFLRFLQEQGTWACVQQLPTLMVFTELHRLRYPDRSAEWRATDFDDLRFLSVALAYCDAVTADKHWATLARRSPAIAARGATVTCGANAVADALQALGCGL
jgi:hypothetical protein